jgi:transcriptional regulator with XRE-family HTH domain
MEQLANMGDPGAAIVALRRKMGLSQTEFGAAIGLASKGKVSVLESSGRASLPVALKIEDLSRVDGVPLIDAAQLNDDVARARAACVGGCATLETVAECHGGDAVAGHGDGDSVACGAASTGLSGQMSRQGAAL